MWYAGDGGIYIFTFCSLLCFSIAITEVICYNQLTKETKGGLAVTRMGVLRHNLIGDRRFYKHMFGILIPIVIQGAFTSIVSLLDNVMVGRVGTLQMSGVAIVGQLLFVYNLALFGGLSGVGIFTAQYHGAEDNEGVQNTVRFKFGMALAIILISVIIYGVFGDNLIGMYLTQGTSAADAAATLKYGKTYLTIMLLDIPPLAISHVYLSTLKETGDTKLPMIAGVAAIIVNAVGNYILIYGNEGLPFLPFKPMGVAGAAIATVFSHFVELAIALIAVHKNRIKYKFINGLYKTFKIPLGLCRDVLVKGTPLLLNEMLWSMGMAAVMQCYSTRGIDSVAAINISNTASNLFSVVYFSMGSAIAIIVGQQLGAGKTEEAKTTTWRLLAFTVASCAIMGTLMFGASFFIPYVYNTTTEVRWIATRLLWIVCLYMPFNALLHGCYFALRSGGKTIITLVFDSGFIWIVSCSLAFILSRYTDLSVLNLYFLVQGVEVIKTIAALWLIKKGIWIQNLVSK